VRGAAAAGDSNLRSGVLGGAGAGVAGGVEEAARVGSEGASFCVTSAGAMPKPVANTVTLTSSRPSSTLAPKITVASSCSLISPTTAAAS